MQENKFYWLDLTRGIAAIIVLSSHLRVLFFLDYPHVIQNKISAFFYFVTGFGHSAVMVFFVLSGFFIIMSIDKQVKNKKWSYFNYIVDRLSRLWIVLIPALILTLVLDAYGLHLFPNSFAYQGNIETLDVNPKNSSSISDFIGNVFFVETIEVPPFGTNTPLWSLAYEFWYYIIFPLLYLSFVKIYRPNVRILCVLLAIAISLFVGEKIMLRFLIWLMGGVCYYLYKENKFNIVSNRYIRLFVVLTFIAVASVIRIKKGESLLTDYLLGAIALFLVFCLTHHPMKSNMLKKLATFLSNISFSLYLFHMPIAVFITSMLHEKRLEFNAINVAEFLVFFSIIIFITYLLWYVFERKTLYVRKWLKTILGDFIHSTELNTYRMNK